jgi:hypothetical protein
MLNPYLIKNTYDWYEPIKHDSIGAIGFQKEFLKGFIRSKSLFLKYRYGFQLIRAYFF